MHFAAKKISDETRTRLLRLFWCLSLISLMACTWPLWTPLRDVPRVPAIALLGQLPPAIDYLLLCLLLCALVFGLLRALFEPSRQRGLTTSLVALAGLMALDQLRWQPWAYELLLVGMVLVGFRHQSGRNWLRLLVVSIYLYAGIAKLDLTFAETLGQQILAVLAGLFGIDLVPAVSNQRIAMALVLPATEILAGIMLLVERTRYYGVALGCLVHLGILLVLGPWGLDHSLGVLAWNLMSVALLLVLFWPAENDQGEMEATESPQSASIVRLVAIVALVMPLTYPLGVWDRWPSWGLYAPAGEQAELYVHRRVASRLPGEVPLEPASDQSPWQRVRLEEWLIQETGAPRYPQNRVTLSLALALDEQARLGDYLQIELFSNADRMTGKRSNAVLLGSQEIRDYAARYWLNTEPVSSR